MKRVIVTGANGFIGKALITKLAESDNYVYAVIRPGREIGILQQDNIKVVYAEMSEYHRLDERITADEVDMLYHFAWTDSAGEGRGNYKVQIHNIEYSCDLIMACQRMKCKRFLYAASIMEYEVYEQMQLKDQLPRSSIYSTGKMAADYMLKALANSCGIEYISLLLSNVYGPGEHSPRLINSTIRKMIRGEHCSFSDGTQLYDFIYIDDAVDMLEALGKVGKANNIYYIGNRRQKLLKEYIECMHAQVNSMVSLGFGDLPSPKVKLSYQEFDTEAVYKDTGIESKVSFEIGIRKTMDWIRKEN